ncbi:fibrinogen- and Ig-binding protein-like [Channa argus]|uniref:fibrinogen- and Ig-binding protein-like n=1 Tax=Channa argus TaxID=215402 RepID=UPI00294407B7|nr:hypothetical protein Q8A73_000473 [Channa argus]
MRVYWIVSTLSALVSMVALMIVMSQYQLLTRLKGRSEEMRMQSEKLYGELMNEDMFKATLENLLGQGQKVANELEATVVKLGSEMEKKKTENDACQAEKKTKSDELANAEKEKTNTEATLKAESDAWNKEIHTLQAQLAAYSPVCDYVKNNTLSRKLCVPDNPTTTQIKESA